ncbi:hypothetical protein SteCoe_18583 [Stentor coeruleus]|uniref:Uncharacterized protein n=1 Tax=Stentor coeruleus TaxID=5963 RepID=A0A1R2BW23_9CILI|nr:hypothetical protein SteCoe_18583 [Stentor coeruleus]
MHISSAPAWSFGGKSDEKQHFNTPGPGNYNPSVSKFENSPNYRIGTSSRESLKPSGTPGPGTYESKSTIINKPAPKIGTSQRPPLNDAIETPGPGTYQIRPTTIEGPKYTMTSRRSTSKINSSPGPGHYDQSLNEVNSREKAPSYKIGTSSRTERPNSAYIPGPGQYTATSRDKGPSWGFGSQSRDNIFKIDVPGPGTYSSPNTLSKRGCSMTGRKPDSPLNSNPGPGSYNPSSTTRPKSPMWSLGKSPRGDFTARSRAVPGPGTYSPNISLGKTAPVFGSSSRPPLSNVTDTPGPGEYNAIPKNTTPSYTMRPRTATQRKNYGPGPGQYNPSASCCDFKWTIGKEQKGMDLSLVKTMSVPGPGYYNTSKGLGGPKWGFGSEPRGKEYKNSNPGPGSYTTYSCIGNLPDYARRSNR